MALLYAFAYNIPEGPVCAGFGVVSTLAPDRGAAKSAWRLRFSGVLGNELMSAVQGWGRSKKA